MNSGEMVFFKTEVPSLNACRWSGLCIIENQLDWLTIGVERKVSTEQVSV